MARTVQGNKVERVEKERREKEKGVKKSGDLGAEVGVKFEIFIYYETVVAKFSRHVHPASIATAGADLVLGGVSAPPRCCAKRQNNGVENNF